MEMELIPYQEFAKLRMKQFVPKRTKVIEGDGFEWMGGFWTSECPSACGFTHISRHEATPEEAGGLEIDFRDLPESDILKIFEVLRLPLRPGMKLKEVQTHLGKPERSQTFLLKDRKSHDFAVGSQHPYLVSVTIHDSDGLIHVAVIRKDILSKCDA